MKVLLSIKPEFAEMILHGKKKYEFRRTIFKSPSIKTVVLYASSPVCRIIGEFEIDRILELDIDSLWEKTSRYAGIDKPFYDRYFDGKETGYAIKVKSAKRYQRYRKLEDYDLKRPPQSFAYIYSVAGAALQGCPT